MSSTLVQHRLFEDDPGHEGPLKHEKVERNKKIQSIMRKLEHSQNARAAERIQLCLDLGLFTMQALQTRHHNERNNFANGNTLNEWLKGFIPRTILPTLQIMIDNDLDTFVEAENVLRISNISKPVQKEVRAKAS